MSEKKPSRPLSTERPNMIQTTCPKCGSAKASDYFEWWTCDSACRNGAFVQSEQCKDREIASLRAQLAELDCRHFALRGKLFQLAAACRAPCQVSGNWAASEIEKLLNEEARCPSQSETPS